MRAKADLTEFTERVKGKKPVWVLVHGVIAGSIPTNTVLELIENGLIEIPTTEEEKTILGN